MLQRGRSSWIALTALGAALLRGVPAGAQDPPPAPGPSVPLERLLKLPSSVAVPTADPRRGGKTRAEWQSRFAAAGADLAGAHQTLDGARRRLEEVAPDKAWSMSAPGLAANATPPDAPIDYKLRQEMRHGREEVERAERHLDDLSVEANLAEVPEDWRTPDPEAKR